MIDQAEYEGISGFMEKFNIQGTELSGEIANNNTGSTLENMEFEDDESEDEDFKLSGSDDSSANDGSDEESDHESESGSGQEESEEESLKLSQKESQVESEKEDVESEKEEVRSEKSVVESNGTTEQENISLAEPLRKRARKSTPKKITGMIATAEAVKKQLEKTRGKMTSLKRLKKEPASNSKTFDNAIVLVESDSDELED